MLNWQKTYTKRVSVFYLLLIKWRPVNFPLVQIFKISIHLLCFEKLKFGDTEKRLEILIFLFT